MKYTSCLLSLLLSLPFGLLSQVNPDPEFSDHVFDENIHTVMLRQKGIPDSYPILILNAGDRLELSFDEMGTEQRNFEYTLIHCDYNWYPSNISENQYIDGLISDYIINISPSFNTYVKYTNYEVAIPSEQMVPKLAGNYIIKVYESGSPEEVVLTRRFYVVAQQVGIRGNVHQPLDPKYRKRMQEVDFEVDLKNLSVSNPYGDIRIVVQQNGRPDSELRNLQPKFVRDNLLIYDYEFENLFEAGNEFRAVDLRSVRFKGTGVEQLTLDSLFVARLHVDEDRSYFSFSSRADLNGKRIIDAKEASNPAVEGDYVLTYFRFKNPYPEEEPDMYLYGELSGWKTQPPYKLHYDSASGYYFSEQLLKQGYYNYIYVLARPSAPPGTPGRLPAIDQTYFEGSYWETENDYTIYVYHRSLSLNTDELAGILRLNTGM
ncbi:MAG: DUF5103 domain-containing protein [Bacteroidia bacterium]